MDTTMVQEAFRALLDAAGTVAAAGDTVVTPPAGEWNAEQVLAHVAIVNATTIAAAASIAAGTVPAYDNRISHDPWTIQRVITVAGGIAGLQERIRRQGEALATFDGAALSEAELNTLVPTLLVSHDAVLVNQPLPLRDLLTGLVESELPGHTQQLLALLPDNARVASAA
ncbi:hypothetical protein OHA70_38735 [Kribbella sp. NBC_00382]|uniref:hypothetical protein n=1 Tax=Kribbella sp. NBC_00382 TaxID=2975967 RepID=UPI002E1AA136